MAFSIPGMSSGLSEQSLLGYIVLGCGALLNVVGWFTAFISQCVAEANGHVDFRHVWFTIFLELALIPLVMTTFLLKNLSSVRHLVIALLSMGTVLSVIATDKSIYSDWGSVEGTASGYILLAIGNLLWLIFICVQADVERSQERSGKGLSLGGITTGVVSAAGNGLRNRFGGSRNSKNEFSSNGTFGGTPYTGPTAPTPATMPVSEVRDEQPQQHTAYSAAPVQENTSVYDPQVPRSAFDAYGAPPNTSIQIDGPEHQVPTNMYSSAPPETESGTLQPPLMPGMIDTNQTAIRSPADTAASPAAMPVAAEGPSPVPTTAPVAVQRAEALYTYKASDDDPTEISFNKGDVLEIIDSSGKWWQARRANGELGIVPSNYLQML